MERFKIKDASLRGYDLLEAVCRGRGFLMRGGICDTDRGCAVVLDEFRAGKVGKLTLEDVPAPKEETPKTEIATGDVENG
jgi:ribosome biogenesis GTPase A